MPNSVTGTPQKSPQRRALGELTPNARTTPRRRDVYDKNMVVTMGDISPLKRHLGSLPTITLPEDPTRRSASPTAGRKRTFGEYDAENAQHGSQSAKRPVRQRRPSLRPIQQLESPWIELDDDEMSTTEEDTPEPDCCAASQESVATKASFSSLVNYNPSQEAEGGQGAPPAPTSAPEPAPLSRAEMLRLRLQIAMYKVQTNQTRVPLSDLALKPRPSESTKSTLVDEQQQEKQDNADPESALPSPQKRTANQTKRSSLSFPPVPVLRPTAYSSRFITEDSYLPSSPPVTARLQGAAQRGEEDVATPVARRHPLSVNVSPERRDAEEENLTSSVVKGRAASGLLELMFAK